MGLLTASSGTSGSHEWDETFSDLENFQVFQEFSKFLDLYWGGCGGIESHT